MRSSTACESDADMEPSDPQITRLLERFGSGDEEAREHLFPLIYGELRAIAGRLLSKERASHTLQTTALVHEAYVKLVPREERGYANRGHFLQVAAQAMRFVLVDHARARGAQKRGEGQRFVALEEVVAAFESASTDLLVLDEALTDFAKLDPQLARLIELRFFAGLEPQEIAEVMGVSRRTVERGWNTARAWLRRRLESGPSRD